MTKRPKFGDIYEINTEKGLAYIQYVNKYTRPPYYGDLVRILDGVFETRPSDFKQLVNNKEVYYTFLATVHYSVHKHLIELVGWEEVPDQFRTIPLFRAVGGLSDPKTHKVKRWRLWDNNQDTYIGRMREKYLDLPTLRVSSLGGIVKMIEEGYTPRNDWSVTGIIHERHDKLLEKLRWGTDDDYNN